MVGLFLLQTKATVKLPVPLVFRRAMPLLGSAKALTLTHSPELSERLDRLSTEMEARDDALRQAFRILTESLVRMQAVLDDIHAAATKNHPPSQVPVLLAQIKDMLKTQPEQIAQAVRAVLQR